MVPSAIDFQAAFEAMPTCCLLLLADSPTYTVAAVSDELLRITHTTRAEVVGRSLFEAYPGGPAGAQGSSPAQLLATLDWVLRERRPRRRPAFRYDARDASGSFMPRYWSTLSQPVFDAGGRLRYVLQYPTDVTEQVLAQQLDQHSPAEQLLRFKFMADQARDPFVLIRQDGSLTYVNQRALDNWGYSADEARQLTIPDIDPLFPAAAFDEIFARAHREPIAPFDSLHRRKDGTDFPVSISLSGLLLGGEPYLFAIPRDVTEPRQVLAALQEANKQLRRTNADLDTFVYAAPHDLKLPITNIEGLLLALREELPPAIAQAPLPAHLLALMNEAVARFQQTLHHLTEVVRLTHAQASAALGPVDLPALVEAVRLDLLPELTASEVRLSVDIDECGHLHCSPKNLRSVIFNLLSNAVKYRSPERPAQVWLRCRPGAPSQVVLEVQDNGLGLSEPQQQELFQLFRRLHPHVAGSGVGLYMVKRMVDNMGGTLTVRSQLGVGSTFVVALPAAPARQQG